MKIGVAGLGFMGAQHLRGWETIAEAKVTAVMSSAAAKLSGDLSGVSGNLSGALDSFDSSAMTKYGNFEDLIADPSLDAIDICLPTYLHVDSAIAALRAGKHVFLEKPLALDAGRAQEVVREAEEQKKILMVGHVLRFFPAYAAAARLLRAESPVRSALFRRRCAAPAWSTWLGDPLKSGGAILDLLIHDIDYCVSVWGMPHSVRCIGAEDLSRGIDLSHSELRYPGLGPIVVTGGWHHPKAYPFSMEFTISTDEGTLDWKSGGELKQYTMAGEEIVIPLDEVDAFAAELAYFVSCIARGVAPERCLPEQSAQAVGVAEMLRESRRRGGEEIVCKA